MSDEEQSADNKSFLARWSQRKHEAKQPDHDAPTANSERRPGGCRKRCRAGVRSLQPAEALRT